MHLRLQRGNEGFCWVFSRGFSRCALRPGLPLKVFLMSPARGPTVSWVHGDSATAHGPRSGQPTGLGPAGPRDAVPSGHTHW